MAISEHSAMVIARMTKTMALRGPDAGGIFVARHVGLGHRRLAVIDLAGGVQPMQAEEEGRTRLLRLMAHFSNPPKIVLSQNLTLTPTRH
jgi:asparagine synthetase B (glutamine-hydrolysing)